MGTESIAWPTKSFDIRNALFDSTLWDNFVFRDDDIIVVSWSKSGTTWVQQILGQLVFEGAEEVDIAKISPWFDYVLTPQEAARDALTRQTHRRFLKTHLPIEALSFSQRAKYLYIGRDGRDVVWSLHNHHRTLTPEVYDRVNHGVRAEHGQRFEPPIEDVAAYFREWLARDGYPWWPFWSHVRGWWAARNLPNVLLVHFADLKRDMPGQIRRIADFLGLTIDPRRWASILEHCSFDYMKKNAQFAAPIGGALWEGGAASFIHKGTNGRWRDLLTADDKRAYEDRARIELGDECANWLMTGELPAGGPPAPTLAN